MKVMDDKQSEEESFTNQPSLIMFLCSVKIWIMNGVYFTIVLWNLKDMEWSFNSLDWEGEKIKNKLP